MLTSAELVPAAQRGTDLEKRLLVTQARAKSPDVVDLLTGSQYTESDRAVTPNG